MDISRLFGVALFFSVFLMSHNALAEIGLRDEPISFYAGIGLGRTKVSKDFAFKEEHEVLNAPGVQGNLEVDRTSGVRKMFTGVKLGKYIGFEYARLDEMAISSRMVARYPGVPGELIGERKGSAQADTLAVVGYWPLSKDFSLFMKVGKLRYELMTEARIQVALPKPYEKYNNVFLGIEEKKTGRSYFGGLGFDYELPRNLFVRGEYEFNGLQLWILSLGVRL